MKGRQLSETVGERLNPKQREWYRDRLCRAAALIARHLLTKKKAAKLHKVGNK